MLYHSNNIINTTAEIMIVPCRMSPRLLLRGAQEEVYKKYGKDYLDEFESDLQGDMMSIGNPGIFQRPPDPWIFNLPIIGKDGKRIDTETLLMSLKEVIHFVAVSRRIKTIAVGEFPGFRWEMVEGLLERLELTHSDQVEFWMYPPSGDGEFETEETVTLPTRGDVVVDTEYVAL